MLLKLYHRIRIKIEKKLFKVYTSIDFLPVWNFYQVMESNDTRYLFKLKDYERLPVTFYRPDAVWSGICEQYFKESVGAKYFQYRTYRLHILQLRNKFLILSNSIYALSLVKDHELIEAVRKLGYRFDDSSEDNYANSIISLNQQLKGLKKIIELKEKEYSDHFLSKGKMQDVYDLIGAIEQLKGFKLDPFTLTVRQFLNYQKRLVEESNKQKAKQFSKEVSHGQRAH